tara:strand:+ start:281 stop:712 length:432 start_codon:yes stop_codon:yes gene_type:complete
MTLQQYIDNINSDIQKYKAKAQSFENKAIEAESELMGISKIISLLNLEESMEINKESWVLKGCTKERNGTPKCTGSTRIVYQLMKDSGVPMRPSEVTTRSKIHSNTVNGIINNGYKKRRVIDKVSKGLYVLNQKGIELLENTK